MKRRDVEIILDDMFEEIGLEVEQYDLEVAVAFVWERMEALDVPILEED